MNKALNCILNETSLKANFIFQLWGRSDKRQQSRKRMLVSFVWQKVIALQNNKYQLASHKKLMPQTFERHKKTSEA